ncbi:MAG: MGMT family protein [Proteobacteria bacterium]|nr:MGMT family protein [Pseudomonadota bacterium]
MAKKTYHEKLHNAGDLPKVEDLSDKPEAVKRFGGSKMLIAAPMQYNAIMTKIPFGKLTTLDRIRMHLAKEANADVTCAMTAGIFVNMCAHASVERGDALFPYWRTLKRDGELNEKYPGGMDEQRQKLESEGHQIVQKGKRLLVFGYEDSLADLRE